MLPWQIIEVRGQQYKLENILSEGNAEVWGVTSQHGAKRVLKITTASCILEEANARQALGWDYHGRFLVRAFDYEGNRLVLERAERTLRDRLDHSSIDRTAIPKVP